VGCKIGALPPIRRLLVDDFPTQRSWISPLLLTFNSFTEAVVNNLTKGLTLADNTSSDVKTVQIANVPTPTTTGGANGPAIVKWTKALPPVAVIVGNVVNLTGTPPVANAGFVLATAVQVQWSMDTTGKYLQITGVVGITPTQASQFALTLICIQG